MQARTTIRATFLSAALVCVAALLPAAELVDRIVVRVERNVITQSEWDDALQFELLSEGRKSPLSAEQRAEVLKRLVDQELLRQQMEASVMPEVPPAEVDAQMETLRKSYPQVTTDEQWRDLLMSYGLTEVEVRERITAQLTILRFIDERFRPSIRVGRDAIEDYYENTYVPDMQRANQKPAPLQEVRSTIDELLTQRRMDELLAGWLQSLRLQSRVIYTDPEMNAAATRQQEAQR